MLEISPAYTFITRKTAGSELTNGFFKNELDSEDLKVRMEAMF